MLGNHFGPRPPQRYHTAEGTYFGSTPKPRRHRRRRPLPTLGGVPLFGRAADPTLLETAHIAPFTLGRSLGNPTTDVTRRRPQLTLEARAAGDEFDVALRPGCKLGLTFSGPPDGDDTDLPLRVSAMAQGSDPGVLEHVLLAVNIGDELVAIDGTPVRVLRARKQLADAIHVKLHYKSTGRVLRFRAAAQVRALDIARNFDHSAGPSWLSTPHADALAAQRDRLAQEEEVNRLARRHIAVTTLAGGDARFSFDTEGQSAKTPQTAGFTAPVGGCEMADGNFLIADTKSNAIRLVNRNTGHVLTVAGRLGGLRGWADGNGKEARFFEPTDVIPDPWVKKAYLVVDSGNHCIRRLRVLGRSTAHARRLKGIVRKGYGSGAGGPAWGGLAKPKEKGSAVGAPEVEVTTVAGQPQQFGFLDGPALEARFKTPWSLVALPERGSVLVVDALNDAVRLLSAGAAPGGFLEVTTLCGRPMNPAYTALHFNDGEGDTARLARPRGLCRSGTDPNVVYVGEEGGRVIRTIDLATTHVATLAGRPTQKGHLDGVTNIAKFYDIWSLLTLPGAYGSLVACRNECIRRVTPDGVVTTLLGRPGETGHFDGHNAAAARFQMGEKAGLFPCRDGCVLVSSHSVRFIRLPRQWLLGSRDSGGAIPEIA